MVDKHPTPIGRDGQIRRFLFWLRCSSLLWIITSLLMPLLIHWSRFLAIHYLRWHEHLIVVTLVSTTALLILIGRPTSWRVWLEFTAWQLLIALIAGLYIVRQIETAVAWLLLYGLSLGVAGLWLFTLGGLPIVILQIRRRRQRRATGPLTLARWWFSCVLVLMLAEPACRFLEVSRVRPIAELEFPRQLDDPPAGEFQIAAIGGSTTLGWPYQPYVSFVQVAALRLRHATKLSAPSPQSEETNSTIPKSLLPRIVVNNLARTGDGIVLDIAQLHRLTTRPHVLVVYTGHNETYHETEELEFDPVGGVPFLDPWLNHSAFFREIDRFLSSQFSALWRLRQLGRSLFDHVLIRDKLKIERRHRFRTRLRQLAEFCKREGIDSVWIVPAGSESGYPPNRSVLRAGTSAAERSQLQSLYDRGLTQEQNSNWKAAETVYREALRLQPQFAEFHFRLATCLRNSGQTETAREHFQKALELDERPVRAQADYRSAIRDVAAEYDIPTISADDVLRTQAPDGILDTSLFLDDVHPTLKATFLLGSAVAQQLVELWNQQYSVDCRIPPMTSESAVAELGMTSERLADAYTTLADAQINRSTQRFETRHFRQREDLLRQTALELRQGQATVDNNRVEQPD